MDILTFLIVGLVAGFISGKIVRGHGFGAIGDIVLGVVGAFMGGLLFNLLGVQAYGFLGMIVMSTVGAVFLLVCANLLHVGSKTPRIN